MACQVSSPISPGAVWRKGRGWGPRGGERGNPFALTDFLPRCPSELETFVLAKLLLPIFTPVLMPSSLLETVMHLPVIRDSSVRIPFFELDGLVGKKNDAVTKECFPFSLRKKNKPNNASPPQRKLGGVSFLQIFPFSATFVLPKTCSPKANGEVQRKLHNKQHSNSKSL